MNKARLDFLHNPNETDEADPEIAGIPNSAHPDVDDIVHRPSAPDAERPDATATDNDPDPLPKIISRNSQSDELEHSHATEAPDTVTKTKPDQATTRTEANPTSDNVDPPEAYHGLSAALARPDGAYPSTETTCESTAHTNP